MSNPLKIKHLIKSMNKKEEIINKKEESNNVSDTDKKESIKQEDLEHPKTKEKKEKKEEKDEKKEEKKEEKKDEKKIEKIAAIVEEPKAPINESTLDFDWDKAEEDDEEGYTKEKRKELEDIYDNTLSTISKNEVIDGNVINITDREVVINIGFKSEGIINLNEFRYNPDLKIGDTVEVYVENTEDKEGQLVLSHKKARYLRAWERILEAFDNDTILDGFIKCRTKGGMIVDLLGIETFLPGSQIDVKPIRDYDIYVNKQMEFKVVKINHEYKNVVVSHKAIIEEELEEQKKKIIAKLEKGQVLEGSVKNITSYGVFMDLGGVDGLIHITDLSWGRVNHPSEIVELDAKLNVVILDFDDEKKRIALGLKQLQPHPWDQIDKELKIGDRINGKVVVIADYGAFIEVAPGVEGLIHVSEMSWSQHLRSAQEFLSVGDKIEAQILTLDREERKMSLGLKQLKPDPWEKIDEKYKAGSTHTAKVRNFTTFGIFIELEEGVDGLVHISDLSWTKKINHPSEFTSIAADLEVIVLDIDKENRRLSLGHKQLEENPWDVFETIFKKDSIHDGTILKVFEKGATISLPYGVEGFAQIRQIKKEDGSVVKVDEKISFKVIEFSKAAKRIVVSHTKIWEDKKRAVKNEENKELDKNKKKIEKNIEKTTLGDVTNLIEIKEKMNKESEEKAKVLKKKLEDKEKEKAKKKDDKKE